MPPAAASSAPVCDDLRGNGAVVSAVAIWGVTLPLTKVALDDFTAIQVAFLRLVFALPILLVLARRLGGLRISLRLAVPLCLTGFVGYFVFTNLGLERTSASAAALVQAATPAMTAALAAAALNERPGRTATVGILLAVAGAAVLAWGTVQVESGVGLLFLLLSTLSWSAYTVLGHRWGRRQSAAGATAVPALLAVAGFAPVVAGDSWGGASAGIWVLVIGTGVFGTGVAYVLWNFGVARVPAARAGVYTNLAPVVALVVAGLALDEAIGARAAVGGAIVIAGAALATARP
jgi:drug/metabolite transporter (DMT)-like permease